MHKNFPEGVIASPADAANNTFLFEVNEKRRGGLQDVGRCEFG